MNRLCTDYVLGQNPCGSSCCVSVFPYFFSWLWILFSILCMSYVLIMK